MTTFYFDLYEDPKKNDLLLVVDSTGDVNVKKNNRPCIY